MTIGAKIWQWVAHPQILGLLTGLLITALITVTDREEVGGLKWPVINTAYHMACDRPYGYTDLRTTSSDMVSEYLAYN